jgi:hypothetical protein
MRITPPMIKFPNRISPFKNHFPSRLTLPLIPLGSWEIKLPGSLIKTLNIPLPFIYAQIGKNRKNKRH